MTKEDNSLDDIFNDVIKKTSKSFEEVFRLEITKIGPKITALMPVEIGGVKFEAFDAKINTNILVGGVSIVDLQNKYLIGKLHTQSGQFTVSEFSDTPLEDQESRSFPD